MLLKPLVLNSIIGEEGISSSFVLLHLSNNVCAVGCIGKPDSDDNENYWIFYDNLEEATAVFSDLKYGDFKTQIIMPNTIQVGPYLFSRIGATVGRCG